MLQYCSTCLAQSGHVHVRMSGTQHSHGADGLWQCRPLYRCHFSQCPNATSSCLLRSRVLPRLFRLLALIIIMCNLTHLQLPQPRQWGRSMQYMRVSTPHCTAVVRLGCRGPGRSVPRRHNRICSASRFLRGMLDKCCSSALCGRELTGMPGANQHTPFS